jgi:hypothetical protein
LNRSELDRRHPLEAAGSFAFACIAAIKLPPVHADWFVRAIVLAILYKQARPHLEFIMKKPERSGNLRLSIARAIIWGEDLGRSPGTASADSWRRSGGLCARQKAASFTLDERAAGARAIKVG